MGNAIGVWSGGVFVMRGGCWRGRSLFGDSVVLGLALMMIWRG